MLRLGREGGARIEHGLAGSPGSPAGLARPLRRFQELVCVSAPVAVVEPNARRSAPDELEIDVDGAAEDVAQDSPVAIDLVESGVGLEANGTPLGDEIAQCRGRCARVALSGSDLGRVDLDEPDSDAVCEHDRVAVDDTGDPRASRRCRRPAGCGVRHRTPREYDDHDPEKCRIPEHSVVESSASCAMAVTVT